MPFVHHWHGEVSNVNIVTRIVTRRGDGDCGVIAVVLGFLFNIMFYDVLGLCARE